MVDAEQGGSAPVRGAPYEREGGRGERASRRPCLDSTPASPLPRPHPQTRLLSDPRIARKKMELFTVRVMVESGFVYSSVPALSGSRSSGSARLASTGRIPSVQPTANPAPPAGDPAPPAGDAAGNATGPAGGAPALMAPNSDNVLPAISTQEWTQIQAFQKGLPYTAIGALSMSFDGFGAGCSGSVIADYLVLTAGVGGFGGKWSGRAGCQGGDLRTPCSPPLPWTPLLNPVFPSPPPNPQHCVYDKASKTAAASMRFSPYNYYDPSGKQQKPFGTVNAAGFEYLAGRRADGSLKPYVSDMAVVLLKTGVAAQTGTLGVAFDRAGYRGKIAAAGYPGMTVSFVSACPLAGCMGLRSGGARAACNSLPGLRPHAPPWTPPHPQRPTQPPPLPKNLPRAASSSSPGSARSPTATATTAASTSRRPRAPAAPRPAPSRSRGSPGSPRSRRRATSTSSAPCCRAARRPAPARDTVRAAGRRRRARARARAPLDAPSPRRAPPPGRRPASNAHLPQLIHAPPPQPQPPPQTSTPRSPASCTPG
jgi:hypothetical protein